MASARRAAAVTAVLAALALVAGCTGPGSAPTIATATPVTPAADPTAAATPGRAASYPAWYDACAAAATTPVTITAWDRETGDVGAVIDELIGEFQAANPGVTVDRTSRDADELAAALTVGLADPAGPDLVQVGSGREEMGAAVRAGLLLPLDEAATRYDWEGRWAPAILARTRFADDGAWGSGTLYGVAMTGEVVGGFFSYDLASRRPARMPPTTLAEEMDDWAAMLAAGHQPFVLGAADGDAIHLFGSLLQAQSEPGWLEDLLFARDGATLATPEAVAAAEMLVRMRDEGFLGEDYAELSHAEAVRRFLDGEGELLWTGSWDAPALAGGGVSLIFTTMTPATPDGSPWALGGPGVPWAIRATTAEPGCATALLDFLTGDHAAELLALRGLLPSHVASGAPSVGTSVYQDLATLFRAASRADRLDPRLESLFPDARATFHAGLARLLAGEVTPEVFVAEIEAAYRAYLATIE